MIRPAGASYCANNNKVSGLRPDLTSTFPIHSDPQITNELASIRKWRDEVGALRKELQGNDQADLYPRVRKELDVSTLRDSLNKVRWGGWLVG